MSAERPGALPTSMAGSVQRRLVLRQADESAYGVLGVPKDVLAAEAPPGRGSWREPTTRSRSRWSVVGQHRGRQVARLSGLAELMDARPALSRRFAVSRR